MAYPLQPVTTTLEKGRPFFNYQKIEDLEEVLVNALYVQRSLEEQMRVVLVKSRVADACC